VFVVHSSELGSISLGLLLSQFILIVQGRGDATPPNNNVFAQLATVANWTNVNLTAGQIPFNNFTANGYFDTSHPAPIPAVITNYTGPGGKGLLPSLNGVNGSSIPPPSPSSSGSASASSSGTASPSAKSAAIHEFTFSAHVLVGMVCISVAFIFGLFV